MNKIIDFNKAKSKRNSIDIPVYSHGVSAGMPVDVSDDIEGTMTLSKLKLINPEHLAIFTVSGESMEPILHNKQKILVDTLMPILYPIEHLHGKIVISRLDGGVNVKRLKVVKKQIYLIPENIDYKPIKVNINDEEFKIIGVMVKAL